jgi:hypothetical protein
MIGMPTPKHHRIAIHDHLRALHAFRFGGDALSALCYDVVEVVYQVFQDELVRDLVDLALAVEGCEGRAEGREDEWNVDDGDVFLDLLGELLDAGVH